MRTLILFLALIFLVGCSTPSEFEFTEHQAAFSVNADADKVIARAYQNGQQLWWKNVTPPWDTTISVQGEDQLRQVTTAPKSTSFIESKIYISDTNLCHNYVEQPSGDIMKSVSQLLVERKY